MYESVVDKISSVAGRIGLGIAALAAVAVALPVAKEASFSLEKTIAVVVAIGAWLWAEIQSGKAIAHPHDVHLFQEAQALMNSDLQTLRTFDFGNPFDRKFGSDLIKIWDTWSGPAHRFQDKEIEAAWQETYSAIGAFLGDLYHCGPFPNSPDTFTVKTGQDIQTGDRSPQTVALAKSLNDNATKVTEAWDKTVQVAIRRLKIASG